MTVVSFSRIAVLKRRPKAYKMSGTNITVGGNNGMYLAALPKPYPINAPQRRVREKARSCGIKKGMSRTELVQKMINCIGKGDVGG